ncbi:MAG: alanine--tRNA ligase [Gammaproteobacteria bacterium]
MITSAEIRQKFIEYFESKGHTAVHSSSLVPGNDKTLLFTNAGMVQFKDVFVGTEKRDYSRAVTSQRCVRAGGKHNDLENVGYTARHHTFFEMLGNFSFGDYFKQDAIRFAWEFLTENLGIPKEKLWVTVHTSDDEAEAIWANEIGVPMDRITRCGDKDNFWQMGDTGPCGPCTEIFYDHGPDIWGGPPGTPEEDGDRYIEIWNLVFMQYNQDKDGNREPLPAPSVDTGMGLERLAAVMQNVHENYEIDLFQRLIGAAAELAGMDDHNNASLKVVADHIRSCAFLITDGVLPSNEGRGYVLRRIIRRAIRHGHKLGIKGAFFHKLVAPLVAEMGEAYPELKDAAERVEYLLKLEEERFAETLEHGLKILDEAIAEMDGTVISGETAFLLYDTYGFPVDLTADAARERELTVDMDGFDAAMQAQRERSRSASNFDTDYNEKLDIEGNTDFTGYTKLEDAGEIIAIYKDGQSVDSLAEGEAGFIVLNQTPFYAESGGQVGDRGQLTTDAGRFRVDDTQKREGRIFTHIGEMEAGEVRVGDGVTAYVDTEYRQATVLNHSATHLMHSALREVLGDHVTQKGSLVNPDRLRFDFAHFEPMKPEEIAEVERIVNDQIRQNAEASANEMSMDDALEAGAMALFGEKYGDVVRVVNIGFSTELCGGTHVSRAGDIGLFRIVSEGGVAAGVRRIEAVTGAKAFDMVQSDAQRLSRIGGMVKGNADNTEDKVAQLLERSRQLEKELEKLKAKLAGAQGGDLLSQAVDINGIKVLAAKLEGADPKSLRDTCDQLKDKLGSAVVVLGTVSGDKVALVAGVTKDKTGLVKAGDIVRQVAEQVGGKGGGRPDMAQAGGNNPAALDGAIASVADIVRAQVQ